MILGIGTDLVSIRRLRAVYEKWGERFLQRVFTEGERAYALRHKDPVPALAKRFAAKEAAAKALGTGIGGSVHFKDIEVTGRSSGAPTLIVPPEALRHIFGTAAIQCQLSLSDEADYALAFVVLSRI